MNKTERQNIYRNHLAKNSIESRVDDDQFADLSFIRVDPDTGEKRRFYILLDIERNLKVTLLDFVKVPSVDGAMALAERMCGKVTFWVPVAKWYVTPINSITAEAQVFAPTPQIGCEFLGDCCAAIEASFLCVRQIPELKRIYEALQKMD